MSAQANTFTSTSKGDTIKATVHDPTFSVVGTINNVTAFADGKLIVKDGEAFTLRMPYENVAPELIVAGESYGEVDELEVL